MTLARIVSGDQDGVPVAAVRGEVDLSNAAELGGDLLGLLGGAGQEAAVLDLSGVSYLDSSGVRLLVELQRALADDGTSLHVVVPATSPLRRLFDVAGLPAALPVHDTMADVRAVLTSGRLAASFAALAARLYGSGGLQQTLERIVKLGAGTIDGTDHAGLMLIQGGRYVTAAATDDFVTLIDEVQYEAGEGPCLDAIRASSTLTDDLAVDPRWPRYALEAAAHGVRSVMAYRLEVEGRTLGALNLYGMRAHAFGARGLQMGSIFAAHAAIVVSEAKAQERDRRLAENLRQALLTRDVIGQAKGMLMERERVTADEAFDLLRRASQDLNVKLSEIAEKIVTGRS